MGRTSAAFSRASARVSRGVKVTVCFGRPLPSSQVLAVPVKSRRSLRASAPSRPQLVRKVKAVPTPLFRPRFFHIHVPALLIQTLKLGWVSRMPGRGSQIVPPLLPRPRTASCP